MFGSKDDKTERLERITMLLKGHEALSQAQIAEQLGVARSTIMRDLPMLEEQAVILQEDEMEE
jgi:DeoR/GlpR family transcriptional regulator of sugar metabolism